MLSSSMRRHRLALGAVAALTVVPVAARAQSGDAETTARRAAALACGKQVVVLGELPSHGEAGAFAAKARIVEELVDRCGFRAVLFEAPAYEFVGLEQAVASGTATPFRLDRAMGRFWLTEELVPWKEWLFRKAASRDVLLAGLDDQLSATSDYARATLPHVVRRHVPTAAAAECEQAVQRYLNWRYDSSTPFDHAERQRLGECATDAASSMARAAGERDSLGERFLLENLAGYFGRQADSSAGVPRDEAMYRNFRWHVERWPAGTKVIIWTSTVHAARRHDALLRHRPLGAWLHDQLGDDLFVIGFTAFGGRSSMAGATPRALVDAPPGSLEAQVTSPDLPAALVTGAELRRMGPVLTRVFGPVATIDLVASFDAVIVLRTEMPPTAVRATRPAPPRQP